jgi:hypothetical protein
MELRLDNFLKSFSLLLLLDTAVGDGMAGAG